MNVTGHMAIIAVSETVVGAVWGNSDSCADARNIRCNAVVVTVSISQPIPAVVTGTVSRVATAANSSAEYRNLSLAGVLSDPNQAQ